MPRLELSITTDYIRDWDLSSGIREFVSNARDAEIEFDAKMKIDWYNDTLRIENVGCTLPREALLLGNSSKMDRSDMLGRFGEGLATGTLALIRAGHTLKIRSGSEMWEPVIEYSDRFNAKVLVFHIHENRKKENRVRVEIGGITKEVWEELRQRFLFLEEKENVQNVTMIKTNAGTLLIDPKHAGQVFVKGIFVQKFENHFGYDFNNASLDRDRKMVDSYDIRYHCNQIWNEAVVKRPDLLDTYFMVIRRFRSGLSSIMGSVVLL